MVEMGTPVGVFKAVGVLLDVGRLTWVCVEEGSAVNVGDGIRVAVTMGVAVSTTLGSAVALVSRGGEASVGFMRVWVGIALQDELANRNAKQTSATRQMPASLSK
jgi:hypothetical protein